MTAPTFTVVIPTRDRPELLLTTLDALAAQTHDDFRIVVVDDSAHADPELDRRAAASAGRLRVVREPGRGLSRARNLGWRRVETAWVAFLDDDVLPDHDWAHELQSALLRSPEATFVSGYVGPSGKPPAGDYVEVTVSPVAEERILSGRWTWPWHIGFTLCMAVRRDVLERLDGFDERLGPGSGGPFPSAEDMDFNYRFLLHGGVALVTPRIRARHDQWRDLGALPPHFRGYAAGWSGFAMKHLRNGDVPGGLWLWSQGVRDLVRMTASSARRRSRLRLAIARAKLEGLTVGTVHGLRTPW
jgi:GT2 family glycosyltransferase